MAKCAILIDGAFYRNKSKDFRNKVEPKESARRLISYCYEHLKDKEGNQVDELYRIFYYDCPPLDKKLQHPLTKKQIDYKKSDVYRWMDEFLYSMTKQRKVALRLGFLSEAPTNFALTQDAMKRLFNGKLKFEDLKEEDFFPDIKQKGVDMKIGIDIASLAYKQQVNKIILIAGDSDFVPASKLARREGIDFVLDPMWHHINADLFEHIDGLSTKMPKPQTVENQKKAKQKRKNY